MIGEGPIYKISMNIFLHSVLVMILICLSSQLMDHGDVYLLEKGMRS
jgi:hypothetical protein